MRHGIKAIFSSNLLVLPALLSGLLAVSAPAQVPQIIPGGGTSTAPHPDSPESGNIYNNFMITEGGAVAGGALLGKIEIAGDPLIWDPVPIHVTCLGKVAFTTYTDVKGQFRITAVNANGALSLQNDAKRQMETHFDGCVVSAVLTGFESSSITLTVRNFRDTPDIGTLKLSKIAGAKGSAVSDSSEDISPKAIKLFEKARSDWEAQNPDHVKSDLQKAVEIDPKFAEAWYQLGNQEQETNPGVAREDYAKAIAIDAHFIRPYEQLLVLDSRESKWKESLTDASHALAIDPRGTPQVWYAYAEAILKAYAAGALPVAKLKIAEVSAANSLALDPLHTVPGTEQLLAVILGQEKNYTAAIEHLRNVLTYAPKGSDTSLLKEQIAQMEQLQTGAAKKP